jgi:hypothetical protein
MYDITFAPQSNRSSWVFIGMVTDLEDNPIDIANCPMIFHVYGHDGYECLTASTDAGNLTVIDLGTFRWFFTLNEMQSLRPQQYRTGLVIDNEDGTQTIQLAVGALNITDGVVNAR